MKSNTKRIQCENVTYKIVVLYGFVLCLGLLVILHGVLC
jgi:hypothetical protein